MNKVKRISRLHDSVRSQVNELRDRNKAATRYNKAKFRKGSVDTTIPETESLDSFTVKELRKMAKAAKIKGFSKMRKDELVRVLS